MPLTADHTAYDPATLGAREDGTTRFALPCSPSGVVQHPGSTALGTWEVLLTKRLAESEPASVSITVHLKRVLRLDDGSYVLADLSRPVSFKPETKPRHEEKHRQYEAGGAHLDKLLLDADSFTFGRDEHVWASALAAARQLGLRGSQLRRISELACRIVLARNGAPASAMRVSALPL